jgi:hypothetical protein
LPLLSDRADKTAGGDCAGGCFDKISVKKVVTKGLVGVVAASLTEDEVTALFVETCCVCDRVVIVSSIAELSIERFGFVISRVNACRIGSDERRIYCSASESARLLLGPLCSTQPSS